MQCHSEEIKISKDEFSYVVENVLRSKENCYLAKNIFIINSSYPLLSLAFWKRTSLVKQFKIISTGLGGGREHATFDSVISSGPSNCL